MGLKALSLSVRAFFPDGRSVTHAEFVSPLAPSQSDGIAEILADRGVWQAAQIVFSRRKIEDFGTAPEPSEALATALQTDLAHLGDWLGSRTEAVGKIKDSGLVMDVFLDLWIDQNQLELSMPPSLLLSCGQSGLKIDVITND